MAKGLIPLDDQQWYTHCKNCGKTEAEVGEKFCYSSGQYHRDSCYDVLFADCLGCGKHCMDALTNLNQSRLDWRDQLCDDCHKKKYHWAVASIVFRVDDYRR